MGVSGEVDHETARGIAAFCVNTKHPFQVLGRAYLDIAHLAPDPDAHLIDEDPLPDGWEIKVVGSMFAAFDGFVHSVFRGSRKLAVHDAWRLHHGF